MYALKYSKTEAEDLLQSLIHLSKSCPNLELSIYLSFATNLVSSFTSNEGLSTMLSTGDLKLFGEISKEEEERVKRMKMVFSHNKGKWGSMVGGLGGGVVEEDDFIDVRSTKEDEKLIKEIEDKKLMQRKKTRPKIKHFEENDK